jgi:type VI secretion system protein ImpL
MRWALVVFVTLVLVGVWILAFLMPDLRWFAEVLTCVVLGAAVLVLVVPWMRERLKRAPADKVDAAGEGREKAAALAARRAQIRKAFGELARLSHGAAAVRSLPWYLALGPPGSGRTAMFERLGLSFVPILGPGAPPRPASERAASVCDLWCSRDAVVVDMKAAPDDVDAFRDEWLLVLDEVRRIRPRRPIEGVLAVVSVPQAAAGEANVLRIAPRLRARIDDVLDRLDQVVPVYVVVTMADRLPGFAEFWAGFSRPDDSTWGASFAADDDEVIHEPARAVGKDLDQLARSLHSRLIERLPSEMEPARRLRILRFPLEFRALASPVTRLVGDLCRPGPAPERFVLRGVYFVSASPASDVPGGPHFLTDFFRSVVLADRNLATPSRRAVRKRASRDVRASFAALGLAVVVLAPAALSYVRNVDLAAAIRAAGAALAANPSSTPGTRSDPVEPALEVLGQCDDAATGIAIPGWWGPRVARELRAPLDGAYIARLSTWMSGPFKQEMDRRLDAVASGHGLSDVPSTVDEETPLRDAYATLKLYASLVEPKGHAREPWAAERLAAVWRSMLPDTDAVSSERLVEHARNYLAAVEDDPALAWPAGRPLAAARERLRRLDVRGIPYRRILLTAKDAPGVRASAIFSPASLEFLASRGDVQIPGPFTANGWDKVREVLHSSTPLPVAASVERWVLDDASLPADDASLRAQVLQAYFDEYTRRWMSFLDELKVQTATNVPTAIAELSALKEGDGFYKTLFDAFKRNAIHDEERHGLLDVMDAGGLLGRIPWFKSEADAATKAAPPSPVENSFRPLLLFAGVAAPDGGGPSGSSAAPIDKYLAILDKLKAVLEAPPAPSPAGPGGPSPFTEASTGVAALLDGIEEPTRGRLWRLLMPPVMGGVTAARAEAAGSLSDDWKSAVWTPWDQKLKGHYPFKAHADAADFSQFAAFFKPDGLLWGFVKARLSDRIEENGEGRYVLKHGSDPLPPELLDCLTTAQEISDAFFAPGEDPGLKLSVQADWTASNVTEAKFWVGSKGTALPKSQWAGPVRWLGEDVRIEWQEDGRPTQELGRHSFSLFDLFEHLGGLRSTGANRSIYATDCPPLTVKLRPEGKVDALRSDFFTRLRCPAEIRGEARAAPP